MYEPIVDTTGPFLEALDLDMTVFEESILAYRSRTLHSTGPNLGKLAVWTRTINRQDQLVMTKKMTFYPLVLNQIVKGDDPSVATS